MSRLRKCEPLIFSIAHALHHGGFAPIVEFFHPNHIGMQRDLVFNGQGAIERNETPLTPAWNGDIGTQVVVLTVLIHRDQGIESVVATVQLDNYQHLVVGTRGGHALERTAAGQRRNRQAVDYEGSARGNG